jgi:hypothetical protein
MGNYLGVVYVLKTRKIKAVINHPDDDRLDDPCWIAPTEPGEELAMLKIPRRSKEYGECPDIMSDQDCLVAMRIAEKILGQL